MGTTAIAWGAAALFAVLAVALIARLRQLTVEVSEAQIGTDKLEGELRATRDQLERESGKLRRKSDELVDVRKRYDKLRKRKDAGDSKSSGPATGSVTDRDLEEARQARDRAREEAASLQGELAAARAAHADALAAERARTPEGAVSPDEAEKLRSESAAALASAKSAKQAADDAAKQVTRLKKRLESQETAYVALRGELEAKKDRLATQAEQIERLQALKVALVDSDAPAES